LIAISAFPQIGSREKKGDVKWEKSNGRARGGRRFWKYGKG
jgi:hypothetical protein